MRNFGVLFLAVSGIVGVNAQIDGEVAKRPAQAFAIPDGPCPDPECYEYPCDHGLGGPDCPGGFGYLVDPSRSEGYGVPGRVGKPPKTVRPGYCLPCKGKQPKSFPWTPCPARAFFQGSLQLGGDVDTGRMQVSIDAKVLNACKRGSKACQRALIDVKNFTIDRIHYTKDNHEIDQRNPPLSPGCSVADVVVTYGDDDDEGVPPLCPQGGCDQCNVPCDFISVVDVSKSMGRPPATPNKTRRLLLALSERFKVAPKFTRFALTSFANDARIQWKLNSKASTNRKKIATGVEELKFTNQFSNHAAGIDSAVDQFKAVKRKVPDLLLLIADGKPNKDIKRLKRAIEKLMAQPNMCFAIVGVNSKPNSEETAFFRHILGCGNKGKCKNLFLFNGSDGKTVNTVADNVANFLCKCAKAPPRVPRSEAVTTVTVRVPEKIIPDFGTREDMNATVNEMLYDAAEAAGITPGRLTAIAIEDTLGNTIGDDITTGNVQTVQEGDATPPATLVEIMIQEPGLNIEPGSQETAREIARVMQNPDEEFAERLSRRGLAHALIDRIAIRQFDGNMPIVDVLQF